MSVMLKRGFRSLLSLKNTIVFFIGALGILLLTIFIIVRFQEQNRFIEQQRLTISLRDDINRHLLSSFSETTKALTQQRAVTDLFDNSSELSTQRATLFLNATREILGASLIYIMDTNGTVIASSFSQNGESLYGNNYKFRPYFTEALHGNNFSYAALGITTKKRGLYFSSPIRNNNHKIVGVAVIKGGLETIDKILLKAAALGPAAILTREGVIFAASEESWLYHTTATMGDDQRKQLIQSGQFADMPLDPLHIDLNSKEVLFSNKIHTIQSQTIGPYNWSVITLVPKKSVFLTILITCFVFTIPLYFFFLKLSHFSNELRYKDKINRQNVHLTKLNEDMKKEIEERKETERKLVRVSEQELRYRMLFEQSKDPITIVSQSGKFLEANRAFLLMMECTREDIKTIHPKEFWVDQGDREAWLNLLIEQGSIIDYQIKQKTKNGTILDLNLTTNATTTHDGKTVYLTIFRDITDKLLDEKELIAAKTAAEQASLAKSNFLANMSHEIRTPMNGIIGMTDIVLGSNLDFEQRSYLEMVHTSAERLLDIINNILDFSKIEAGRLELEVIKFNILEKLDELVSFMSVKAEKNNVALSAAISPAIPTQLMGDPTRLMQILINLTNNAIKFSENGKVTINVRLQDQLSANKVLLYFSVQDTGIGVPPEKQAAIFESFSQADSSTTRQYGGTGLGLTISSELCRLMGGEIGLDNSTSKGSLFWFTAAFNIPDQRELEGGSKQGTIVSSELTREEIFKDVKILLAEDDYINRTLALAVLEKAQLRVTTVTNGIEAVQKTTKNHYDLILMDIQMPEMDGYEATRKIREFEKTLSKHIPIVAMTAHAIKGDREKCLASGMDDYITKPIDPIELYTTIETHLLYRVLVADGHQISRKLAARIFTEIGWQVTLANNSSQCLWECENSSFDLILIDILTADINLEEIADILSKKAEKKGHNSCIAAISGVIDEEVMQRCQSVNIEEIIEKPLTKKAITTLINAKGIIR